MIRISDWPGGEQPQYPAGGALSAGASSPQQRHRTAARTFLTVGWTGICVLALAGCARPPTPRAQPHAAAQQHIREIAETLPVGSHLRRELEAGQYGSGFREEWMDAMRRHGVKRVQLATEFFGFRPIYIEVTRLVYFSEYNYGSCSQIADVQRLSQIRASGLEKQLIGTAKERTAAAPWWPTMDPHLPRVRGRSQFNLFADEWLPEIAFLTGLPDRRVDPFVESASMGDLADVTARLARGVGPSLRDEAMWVALLGNDPCMTTALLGSGVDPNLRDRDGSTLLMAAVRLNALGTAKALLDAGADVNAPAELPSPKLGRTPLSWAVGVGNQEMIHLLRDAGARV